MMWFNYSMISITILLVAVFIAIIFSIKQIKWYLLTPNNLLVFGAFCSAWILLYPTYSVAVPGFNALILSAQNAIRLFGVDENFFEIIERVEEAYEHGQCTILPEYYKTVLSLYHMVTPVFTVTLILSFFKNVVSWVQYKLSFYKDIHI